MNSIKILEFQQCKLKKILSCTVITLAAFDATSTKKIYNVPYNYRYYITRNLM